MKFLEGQGTRVAVGGEIGRERGDAFEKVLGSGTKIEDHRFLLSVARLGKGSPYYPGVLKMLKAWQSKLNIGHAGLGFRFSVPGSEAIPQLFSLFVNCFPGNVPFKIRKKLVMNLEVCTCKRSESGQIIITNPACPIHGKQAPKGEAAPGNKIQISPPWDLDSFDEDADESRNYDEEKAKKEQEEKDRTLEAEESLRVHLDVLNQAQYEDERIKKETMRNLEVEDLSISQNLLNQHKRISDSGHKISL